MADFETTTYEKDCRVWAWGVATIENPEDVEFGNSISSMMEYMQCHDGTYYFHNLKFDGNFIIYWLLTHGYEWTNNRRLNFKQFSTLISDMGSWYSISIMFEKTINGVPQSVTIKDSSKLIPLPVSEIPGSFGLVEQKLDLDYVAYREPGHQLTESEKMYLRNDVVIVAKAIRYMLDNKQVKMTAASNAMNDYKNRIGKKQFNKWFPELPLEVDLAIRRSYKGGWTYVSNFYKNKEIKEGSVFDVNSMYPWAMKYCMLPYGKPYYYTGDYPGDENFPLYVQHFTCAFKIKPGHYPSIQIKNSFFADNQYLTTSYDEKANPGGIIDLCLTSVDLKLFFDHYDVYHYQPLDGYMFHGRIGMFDSYIDYWYETKSNSKKTGNHGMERIAKLMLNSLYGKFGARPFGRSKIPVYDADLDKIRYVTPRTREDCFTYGIPLPLEKRTPKGKWVNAGPIEYGEEERKGGYIPVATFITSYCRDKIIRGAQLCGTRFIYADTDSLHIAGYDYPEGLEIDEYKLGAFKQETKFIRAKFIRQKTYLEVYVKGGKEKMNLKCAGMPDKMKDCVTEDMFYEGAVFDHETNPDIAPKLMPKVVPGGVILVESSFQIKKVPKVEVLCMEIDGQFHYEDCPYASRYI